MAITAWLTAPRDNSAKIRKMVNIAQKRIIDNTFQILAVNGRNVSQAFIVNNGIQHNLPFNCYYWKTVLYDCKNKQTFFKEKNTSVLGAAGTRLIF